MFGENVIKNPTCFGHYHMAILRGRLLYLVRYHFSPCLLRHLHYSVCGCMCRCECVTNLMFLVPCISVKFNEVTN
jgi:hypothetical protein